MGEKPWHEGQRTRPDQSRGPRGIPGGSLAHSNCKAYLRLLLTTRYNSMGNFAPLCHDSRFLGIRMASPVDSQKWSLSTKVVGHKIAPGLRMPCGSRAFLMVRVRAMTRLGP